MAHGISPGIIVERGGGPQAEEVSSNGPISHALPLTKLVFSGCVAREKAWVYGNYAVIALRRGWGRQFRRNWGCFDTE